ncbi:anti sigma factor C-terminal domain-containing protein [uncultured Vagococcus sp.]|uniref:anti sigma factor C-terminal domain-containing protein n=1 Tax=uncultured Vagococcus sp. TaxID=189676 RepID=UPI0028D1CC59|nr:anti sigma factor C-terminal domain-containing protein [uncultured Vagococcus sp.]
MEKREFEERLKAYQLGWLSPKEMTEIEADIEKARAIQDYLFAEEIKEDLELEISQEIDSRAIQKSVSQRFIKQGFLMGAVVLVVLLIIVLIGGPLINKLYLNPLAGKTNDRPSDYELYQRANNYVYTTGDVLTGIFIEPKGIGKYEIHNTSINSFTHISHFDTTTIKASQQITNLSPRGHFIELGDLDMFSTDTDFFGPKNVYVERKIAQIEGLPESAWIKVDINFGQSLSIEEMLAFIQEEKIVHPLYTKVETVEDMQGIPQTNFGFRFSSPMINTDLGLGDAEKKLLDKDYPNLFRSKLLSSGSDPEMVREHFISALTYLVDHQSDVPKNKENEFPTDDGFQPEGALRYVKEHGVRVGRLVVAIPKGAFTSLVNNNKISSIGVPEVILYAPHLDKQLL